MDKINRSENEYNNREINDCPHCKYGRPDHSCGNCCSDMSQQECWKWKGYCSEKCLIYITQTLPKIRQEKIDAGIKCRCDEPQCAKCLGGNCRDDACISHSIRAKLPQRMRALEFYKNDKESPQSNEMLKFYEAEVVRLRSLFGL